MFDDNVCVWAKLIFHFFMYPARNNYLETQSKRASSQRSDSGWTEQTQEMGKPWDSYANEDRAQAMGAEGEVAKESCDKELKTYETKHGVEGQPQPIGSFPNCKLFFLDLCMRLVGRGWPGSYELKPAGQYPWFRLTARA